MRQDGRVLIFILVLVPSVLSQCLVDKRATELLKESFSDFENYWDEEINVDISLDVHSLNILQNINQLELEATLVREWKIPALRASQSICSDKLSITKFGGMVPVPPVRFSNAIHYSVQKHSVSIYLLQNGTFVHSERFKQTIPCVSKSLSYPFGNTTCSLLWAIDDSLGGKMNYTIKKVNTNGNQAGEFVLSTTNSIQDGTELSIIWTFFRGPNKLLFLFYLPSTLFLIIPWLSLLLGPMAITRVIMNMISLILLLLVYLINFAGLPETSLISAVDLWKIFSLLFVIMIIVELVVVTLMASLGRTRKCSRNRSGRYEMEPLYEEMNDLRNRRTRRTCGVCRISALIVDLITFIVMGTIFVVFNLCYYYEKELIVDYINNFKLEQLKFF
ncbi:unnamed protein product [Caenorhabditis angaria]|uniref:Neurotransmitter-gated ion-channel ligand-binding domain-containing protein n=1 Tax=Caenorhabditis angaria TaxID=860376 RepID=A0A9P1J1N6_9PELO|nr:unnamed protein product [Caenorhabditis angaria]